jgi:hypothetical protein
MTFVIAAALLGTALGAVMRGYDIIQKNEEENRKPTK